MTWIFSISPDIPGLEITTDGDNKATLRGHPLYAFTGLVTITATDGTVTIDSVLQLDLVPLDKVSIVAIENQSQFTNTVTFGFTSLEVSVFENQLSFSAISVYSATLPQQIQFTSD